MLAGAVFIDTGGWIAVAVSKDQYNSAATDCYRDLLAQDFPLVTSDYVLDETVTRIRYDVDHAHAVQFLDLIEEAQWLQFLTVLRIDESILEAARGIFKQYSDQVLSFTDCTSFALCQQESIKTAFAFDHHFIISAFSD
jgi:hypothetical protein